ncbi:hypothetical protein FRC19_011655 [Serendipita sp. 401]|nr:hypothetical protein FRC19_011655 [Serendipita sp. 401]
MDPYHVPSSRIVMRPLQSVYNPPSCRSISIAQAPTPGTPRPPSVHQGLSVQGAPTSSVIATIPDAASDIAATLDGPSLEGTASSASPSSSTYVSHK